MKVAVDFDGVLCDTHRLSLALLNREFKTDFTEEDWTHWFWSYEAFGKDAFWSSWDFIDQHDLRLAVGPFPYALGAIRRMVDDRGWTVDIVTGNREAGASSIEEWMDRYPYVFHGVGLISREPGGWTWKGELDYDVFIEDATPFFEKVPTYPRPEERLWIIYDRPWNRTIESNGNNIIRAADWSHILPIIETWEARRSKL